MQFDKNEVREMFEGMLEGFSIGFVRVDTLIVTMKMKVTFLEDEYVEDEYDEDEYKYVPNLIIKDRKKFYDKLYEFAKAVDKSDLRFCNKPPEEKDELNVVKYLLCMVWFDATIQDFGNPIEFLDRYINFIQDRTFEKYKKKTNIGDIDLPIPKNGEFSRFGLSVENTETSCDLETPHHFTFSINGYDLAGKKVEEYDLPGVAYGISEKNGEKVGYIYSIQDFGSTHKKSRAFSIFNRKSQSLRHGVMECEDDEYKEYAKRKEEVLIAKNSISMLKGSDPNKERELQEKINDVEANNIPPKYCENISEVSPTFIISLLLSLELMYKEGIKKIVIPDMLFERYINRSLMLTECYVNNSQKRCTDQLIRTFRRLEFHCPEIFKTMYYPGEYEECFSVVNLSGKTLSDNPFLNELSSLVKNFALDEGEIIK